MKVSCLNLIVFSFPTFSLFFFSSLFSSLLFFSLYFFFHFTFFFTFVYNFFSSTPLDVAGCSGGRLETKAHARRIWDVIHSVALFLVVSVASSYQMLSLWLLLSFFLCLHRNVGHKLLPQAQTRPVEKILSHFVFP